MTQTPQQKKIAILRKGSLPENQNINYKKYDLDQSHNEKMATKGERNTYKYNANHGRFNQPQNHLGQRNFHDLQKGLGESDIPQLHERYEQGKKPTSAYKGKSPYLNPYKIKKHNPNSKPKGQR
jgi:hypothetical protein